MTNEFNPFITSMSTTLGTTTFTQLVEIVDKLSSDIRDTNLLIKNIAKAVFSQIAQLTTSIALMQISAEISDALPAPFGAFFGAFMSAGGGYLVGQGIDSFMEMF